MGGLDQPRGSAVAFGPLRGNVCPMFRLLEFQDSLLVVLGRNLGYKEVALSSFRGSLGHRSGDVFSFEEGRLVD